MASNKPSFLQGLQRALQLDLFGDMFALEKGPEPKRVPPRTPSLKPQTPQRPAHPTTPHRSPSIEGEARTRQILLGEVVLEYELRRSKRRSIGFLIGENGLRITAPRWVTLADIEQAIHEKQAWILKHLREKRERQAQRQDSALRFEDGAKLALLGQDFTLRFTQGRSKIEANHVSSELLIQLPIGVDDALHANMCRSRLKQWLQQQAKLIFSQRMPELAEQLGVRYSHMQLSSAGTRWGSCTSNGVIRLNWRLIHLDPELIDYVIAHELAHLIEMNHSPAFWATVARIYPHYDRARKQLKEIAVAGLPQI